MENGTQTIWSMERLIEELQSVYCSYDECTNSFIGDVAEITNKIKSIIASCTSLLVCMDGSCNWHNIRMLEGHGYRVYAVKKSVVDDSWITGRVDKLWSGLSFNFGTVHTCFEGKVG